MRRLFDSLRFLSLAVSVVGLPLMGESACGQDAAPISVEAVRPGDSAAEYRINRRMTLASRLADLAINNYPNVGSVNTRRTIVREWAKAMVMLNRLDEVEQFSNRYHTVESAIIVGARQRPERERVARMSAEEMIAYAKEDRKRLNRSGGYGVIKNRLIDEGRWEEFFDLFGRDLSWKKGFFGASQTYTYVVRRELARGNMQAARKAARKALSHELFISKGKPRTPKPDRRPYPLKSALPLLRLCVEVGEAKYAWKTIKPWTEYSYEALATLPERFPDQSSDQILKLLDYDLQRTLAWWPEVARLADSQDEREYAIKLISLLETVATAPVDYVADRRDGDVEKHSSIPNLASVVQIVAAWKRLGEHDRAERLAAWADAAAQFLGLQKMAEIAPTAIEALLAVDETSYSSDIAARWTTGQATTLALVEIAEHHIKAGRLDAAADLANDVVEHVRMIKPTAAQNDVDLRLADIFFEAGLNKAGEAALSRTMSRIRVGLRYTGNGRSFNGITRVQAEPVPHDPMRAARLLIRLGRVREAVEIVNWGFRKPLERMTPYTPPREQTLAELAQALLEVEADLAE
ncbi:hypothetical protein [Stratiformator vulcanicus]|uniref:Uncharacterized protein n=1 Tax=Stratiformator vulcanicus TaxID=2527980 RepID=A0A517QZC4_9PLAN|nr:hypothetical protein [Stratiformator vulcanicus]QDT36997.1 hypothetical protein Pan189_13620 [Stratiformator vulcanicus]